MLLKRLQGESAACLAFHGWPRCRLEQRWEILVHSKEKATPPFPFSKETASSQYCAVLGMGSSVVPHPHYQALRALGTATTATLDSHKKLWYKLNVGSG